MCRSQQTVELNHLTCWVIENKTSFAKYISQASEPINIVTIMLMCTSGTYIKSQVKMFSIVKA